MTDETRDNLRRPWTENERRIADTHELKAGKEAPPDAEARLEREQDEIEADLGTDWFQRRRELLDDE